MFAKDTIEDPAMRIERDGFLDEIEQIAEASRIFDASEFAALDAFLAQPGPMNVPEPERLEAFADLAEGIGGWHAAASTRSGTDPPATDSVTDSGFESVAHRFGVEETYAYLGFANQTERTHHYASALQRLAAVLPVAESDDAPYLEQDLIDLPEISQPRVEPRKLSTGSAPLEIVTNGAAWSLSCTGCGATSEWVEFRWKALDQTVGCRCEG